MTEYLHLGHMQLTKVPSSCVIPHHAVFKRDSGKIRVVFDGSAKGSTGSLNDHLLPGPQLQKDITDIILRFRRHPIVFTADVVKMYRQILIRPSDRIYQHILWRFSPDLPVDTYELNTITYGLKPSPYQAMRVLRQLVADEGSSFPAASTALTNDIYVDDIATGAQDISSAIALKIQLKELLARGCMQLSKWTSNAPAVIEDEDHSDQTHIDLTDSTGSQSNVKILGLRWSPVTDCFSFFVDTPTININHTKRTVLSTIARLYDPLGFLAPVIFYAKLILQNIWKSQCDWDDDLPAPIHCNWVKFIHDLPLLKEVSVYRYLGTALDSHCNLVGFCDASESGYCAALYLCTNERSTLIKAKTKVAPLKTLTIPRLELLGAVLLARLVKSIKPLLQILSSYEVFLFTDSTIVLSWLLTPPHTLKTFVAHRVVHLLEMTESSWWKHVASMNNPADCGSRGLLPSQLLNHSLWWAGPTWISSPLNQWPTTIPDVKVLTSSVYMDEVRHVAVALISIDTSSEFVKWTERFSQYARLLRAFVYVLRFPQLCKRRMSSQNRPINSEITTTELETALTKCVLLLQHHYYPEAFEKPARMTTQLQQLGVFQDDQGLLRVGGRLRHSTLTYDQKHPILLPRQAHFSTLLVRHYHRDSLHIGCAALKSIIQHKFWIVSLRVLCRKIKRSCIVCIRASKPTSSPYMGDLPSLRFSETNAFHHTAVDFAGPFLARETSRRKAANVKVYMSLFICLSTKAIHLEVAHGLSTEAFIDVLDRFVARRGRPLRFLSDCGTNFVGTANYYHDLCNWIDSSQTQEALIHHATKLGITWDFNPPRSPHFGGIFEAGIKSAKGLLLKLFGTSSFTIQELSTAFTKVEAILNSRPLYPASDDPDDCHPLTPGHFLIGGPIVALPEPDLLNIPSNRMSRWQLIRERTQTFWQRWRDQYLNYLTTRRKWYKHTINFKIDDIVFLKDTTAAAYNLPYGKIIQVHPGADGTVRVVTVKTNRGVFTRSVHKLISLQPLLE